MHLTLKKETTRPPRANILQQQARFDDFVSEFNGERPHDALAMKTPVEVYRPSAKPYHGLPEIDYPFHDRRSAEHTSELQSLMRISYAVFCLKKKKHTH